MKIRKKIQFIDRSLKGRRIDGALTEPRAVVYVKSDRNEVYKE